MLGWLRKRADQDVMMARARAIAKRDGLPTKFIDLDPDEVATLYHELVEAPTRAPPR
jgi:hypothetical protein